MLVPPTAPTAGPESDACYLALKAHDARFDGSMFFTGVTSTGIYCRPVCRVRMPRRENCRFFAHAAQAEGTPASGPACAAGPNSRRRTAALVDAKTPRAMLAQQAARPARRARSTGTRTAPWAAGLAARLGVSDRHLRRIFEAQLGVSPLQYLQTRRLLSRQAVAGRHAPADDAGCNLASGFGSVRRFNAAFVTHYGLNPSALRREGSCRRSARPGEAVNGAAGLYRPPYDVAAMLGFFRPRRLIEAITDLCGHEKRLLARTLRVDMGGTRHAGWLLASTFDAGDCQLVLRVSESLHAVLPLVIQPRARRARPRRRPAWRSTPACMASVPAWATGCACRAALDGFELAVRAVLGQQITVAAARTLAQRLVHRLRRSRSRHRIRRCDRLFPAPAVPGAAAEGDALGQLGIVRQRQAAIVRPRPRSAWPKDGSGAARRAPTCPPPSIALQGPARHRRLDRAVHRHARAALARCLSRRRRRAAQGAGRAGARARAREAEAASQAWKPWRSYAVRPGLAQSFTPLPATRRHFRKDAHEIQQAISPFAARAIESPLGEP
jgi:AraC family transcriptional regulator of adaptative response / DNA-3-methyladenine glycosylase II